MRAPARTARRCGGRFRPAGRLSTSGEAPDQVVVAAPGADAETVQRAAPSLEQVEHCRAVAPCGARGAASAPRPRRRRAAGAGGACAVPKTAAKAALAQVRRLARSVIATATPGCSIAATVTDQSGKARIGRRVPQPGARDRDRSARAPRPPRPRYGAQPRAIFPGDQPDQRHAGDDRRGDEQRIDHPPRLEIAGERASSAGRRLARPVGRPRGKPPLALARDRARATGTKLTR